MLKMVGNSGQFSLGKKYAGKYFEVEQQPDGAVLLRPMKLVPLRSLGNPPGESAAQRNEARQAGPQCR